MGIGLKKKKKKLKTRGSTSGGGPRVTSNLRPYNLEKLAPCMDGCPQGTEVRKVLMTIAKTEDLGRTYDESYEMAWNILVDKNAFPSVCGRVCPHPCEDACNRQYHDEPLNFNQVERFVGDFGIKRGLKLPGPEEKRDEKIAILGAGPAGLNAAYHLARRGYGVTVYEAFDKAGGMLRYGIPAYRLPRDVLDAEIQRVLDLGVELKLKTAVGRDIPYEEVRQSHKAVFVAIGAHQGRQMRVKNEDAEGVYRGAEFLNACNSGEPPEVGDKVLVIGGGNTAIDAARACRRLGAGEVTIVYRRTIEEMPAISEEIEGAREEGVKIEFLVQPIEVLVDGGKVSGLRCMRQELGEPDESGRRRPVPIEGSEFEMEATAVVAAISQEPGFDGLDKVGNSKDWVKVDAFHRLLEEEGVFGGGDVTGLALVTTALAQGRFAAEAIDAYCRGEEPKAEEKKPLATKDRIKFAFYDKKQRLNATVIAAEERLAGDGQTEINKGMTEEQIREEAKRCMSCGYCFGCGTCWSFCQDNAIVKPADGSYPYKYKLELCQGCKKCHEECPCGFIEMQ